MSKENLEKEIAKGNVSTIAFYNPDGSNMLYTQKYVEQKDKEIKRLNKKYEDAVADYEEQKYIISELEKYLEKIIIDGGTRGSMTFWYRQIYEYLKELKGDK